MARKPGRISVIVSAYQRPDYLTLVLRGYAAQTDRAFELVIADDGSGPEVRRVVEEAWAETDLDLVHVWHEDQGFRKTRILNRAIVASTGDYLVFTDGDCIPRHDMVAMHRALARPDRFVAGGYLKLSAGVTERIGTADVESGRVTDLRWLRRQGWRPGRRALRLVRSRRIGALFDRMTPTKAQFQGNNASTWRAGLLAVNGLEGEMGYGGEDRALGYRLKNVGYRGIQARHRIVAMHLEHERPYRSAEVIRRNDEILRAIRRRRETRARDGIAELPPDPTLRIDRRPA